MGNTLDSHITAYLADRRRSARMTRDTAAQAGYVLAKLSRHFGARPLNQLTGRHIQQWVDGLDHLAPSTRRGHLSRVSAFCAWLVARTSSDATRASTSNASPNPARSHEHSHEPTSSSSSPDYPTSEPASSSC